MTSEHLKLEDILGGVEEEIRRAEARLKLDTFQWRSAGSALPLKNRGLDSETHHDEISDVAGSRCVSGELTSKSLDEGDEVFDAQIVRRHAWANDHEPQLVSDDPSINGSNGYGSPRRRASLVNRLLRERDARLRTSAGSLAEQSAVSPDDMGCRTEERSGTINSGQAKMSTGNHYSTLEVDAGTNPAVDGSLESSGEIFFASDILDESSCGDRRSEDTRSFNLRDLATGIFGSKIVPQDTRISTPEKRLGSPAGAAGYPNQRTKAVQRVHEIDFSKAEEPDSRSVEDATEDAARAAIPSRSGSRDNACADLQGNYVRQNIEGDLYGDRGTTAAKEQLGGSVTGKPNVKKCYNSRGEHNQMPAECRIKELARDRQQIYSDRERQRREKQEKEEAKECTFRPKLYTAMVTKAATGDEFDELGRSRIHLHERLHKEAREKEAARALAQHHLEAQLLRECTFQPALRTANDNIPVNQRPLHQRVREVERQREYNLRMLQADKEEREGATFAPPPLGRVSERLARGSRPASAVAMGLTATSWEGLDPRFETEKTRASERRRQRLREHEEAEARMNTFEPTISRGSERLIRRRPELQMPFDERSAMMEARKREREQLRLEARAEEETKWFNPATAKRTESLLRRRMPQRLEETAGERIERMAGAQDQRRRKLVDQQRAKEQSDCPFRPALNPVTQSIGQAAPLDELVNNRRGERVRERAHEKARNANACTHKPALIAEQALSPDHQEKLCETSKRTHHERFSVDMEPLDGRREGEGADGDGRRKGRGAAAALYGPGNKYRLNIREPGRMAAELRVREREQAKKLRALRDEREVAEMQSCTFVPQMNEGIVRAHGPVVVRGLGRHLQLKDVAQQQEADRREREAQAFGVRPGAVRRTALGETLVEPFSLSEGTGKGWWEGRRQRHEAERAAQCTFKPRTVEGERSKALSRLLEWSSVLSSVAGESEDRSSSVAADGSVDDWALEAPST